MEVTVASRRRRNFFEATTVRRLLGTLDHLGEYPRDVLVHVAPRFLWCCHDLE